VILASTELNNSPQIKTPIRFPPAVTTRSASGSEPLSTNSALLLVTLVCRQIWKRSGSENVLPTANPK
jgi:hypothetical protein